MEHTAKTVASDGLVLAILEDLLGRRPVTDDDQVLDGRELLEGQHFIEPVLDIMELLPTRTQECCQLMGKVRA